MALKDVIKDARLKQKLKQDEAAKLTGVTVQTYSKWENGKTEPKASQVAIISKILKVSTDAICNGEESQKLDPMEFLRAYSRYSQGVNPFDETMAIYEHIDDDKSFLNTLKSYSEFPDEILEMDLPEPMLQEALEKSKETI